MIVLWEMTRKSSYVLTLLRGGLQKSKTSQPRRYEYNNKLCYTRLQILAKLTIFLLIFISDSHFFKLGFPLLVSPKK